MTPPKIVSICNLANEFPKEGYSHKVCYTINCQCMCHNEKIFKCKICGTGSKLTLHHVYGGKKHHRKNNPYFIKWHEQDLETVPLCRECHDKCHLMDRAKEFKKKRKKQ